MDYRILSLYYAARAGEARGHAEIRVSRVFTAEPRTGWATRAIIDYPVEYSSFNRKGTLMIVLPLGIKFDKLMLYESCITRSLCYMYIMCYHVLHPCFKSSKQTPPSRIACPIFDPNCTAASLKVCALKANPLQQPSASWTYPLSPA